MIMIKHSLIITGEPTHTASKQWHHGCYYHLTEDALLPFMFNLLYSSTNRQLFEKNLCNQSSPMKITDDFRHKLNPSHTYKIDILW